MFCFFDILSVLSIKSKSVGKENLKLSWWSDGSKDCVVWILKIIMINPCEKKMYQKSPQNVLIERERKFIKKKLRKISK